MNYQFANTVTCKLAIAAMLGCSCCSTLILGQQQTAVSQAQQSGLPPIVRASEMTKNASTLPPIVPIANAKLPEATPVEFDLPDSVPTIPANTRSPVIPVVPANAVRGKNFPTNASEQIADFIRNNETRDVENAAFLNPLAPEANQPSRAIMPLSNTWQQDSSPSDWND